MPRAIALLLVASVALLAAIPADAATPCSHIVVKDDSLYKLAEEYDLDVEDVIDANPQLEDPEVILEGSVVFLPCEDTATSGDSILDLLLHRPDTRILTQAVAAAGLAETLASPELDVTLFAPNDEAFIELLDQLQLNATELLADTELLTQVLQYHVVTSGVYKGSDLEHNEEMTTLLDGKVLRAGLRTGKLKIKTEADQRVRVIEADMEAGSALVHIVKEVLIPFPAEGEEEEEVAPPPSTAEEEEEGATPEGVVGEPSKDGCTFTVGEGDILFNIGEEFGTTVDDLLALNPKITDPKLIQPGQVIKLKEC